MTTQYHCVDMQLTDLPRVLTIEAQGHPRPWTETMFRDELVREYARVRVAKNPNGIVLGYCNFWIIVDEIQLHNIVVDKETRRSGLGRLLLQDMLDIAGQSCQTATLEVRAGNTAAIALYLEYGFCEVGRRVGYYTDNREDALLMNLAITGK